MQLVLFVVHYIIFSVGDVFMTNKIIVVVLCVISYAAGWGFRMLTHVCPTVEPEMKTEVKYEADTKTEVVYVPKYIYVDGSTEKTDVDVQIGKQELNVKVNGKEFEIKKADDEKYIFDKNKLQLTQTSFAELNIKVPTIDKTKRWEIGIGRSKDGAVGLIGFPINNNVGGWIAGSKGDVMIGVSLKI